MHEGLFAASLHDPIVIIKNELPKVGSSCNSLMVERRKRHYNSEAHQIVLFIYRAATALQQRFQDR